MTTQSFISTVKKYIKKPWIIGLLIIVLLIVIFSVRGRSSNVKSEVVIATFGTVSEEVSVTGTVKPANAVDLSFEKSGKVARVTKAVGESVSPGETIIQLSNSDLSASLAEAQAVLAFQQSQLAISQSDSESAKTDLVTAQTSLVNALQASYSSADDAIRNKIDNFFLDPRSQDPVLAFKPPLTSQTSLESGRKEVEIRLNEMKSTVFNLSTTSPLETILESMKQDLGEIKLFLDNVSIIVYALTPTSGLSASSISTWKTDLSSARTSLNTAITNVLSAEDKLNSVQTRSESQKIKSQQAHVDEARARVSSVYAELAKTSVKSPIAGVVIKQDARVGETVFANTIIASVISNGQWEIESFIPEADVAKVNVGQTASVTLDAYGPDAIFSVHVVSVDPAETMIDGVPTYKTTFQFERPDPRIKSGMTANIDIAGKSHTNVIAVPQRAVINRGSKKYVVVRTGKDTDTDVLVKTGLRGSSGMIEIVSGLNEGDAVVVSK